MTLRRYGESRPSDRTAQRSWSPAACGLPKGLTNGTIIRVHSIGLAEAEWQGKNYTSGVVIFVMPPYPGLKSWRLDERCREWDILDAAIHSWACTLDIRTLKEITVLAPRRTSDTVG